MSIPFSNTTTKGGLIQIVERNLGFADAGISGDSTLLAQTTSDINIALDEALSNIFEVGGTWQFDDSNHTDYPIITTNLVSGQRDYSFTVDGNSNLILEIFKVMVADQNGVFHEIKPVDVSSGRAPVNFDSGQNVTGIPNTYDKLANGIFLDAIPSYNYTAGLKIYINREASYFTTSDTTKKAGFAGLYHIFLAWYASYMYAFRKSLPIANGFLGEMTKTKEAMKDHYKSREKDARKFIKPLRHSSR